MNEIDGVSVKRCVGAPVPPAASSLQYPVATLQPAPTLQRFNAVTSSALQPAATLHRCYALPLVTLATFVTLVTLVTPVTPPAFALTADNPYLSVTNRNLFALKPPPPPVKPEDLVAKTPPPPITLTGITTIFGSKKALLIMGAVTGKPAPAAAALKQGQLPTNPAEANKPQSFILCEGQREGDLEVVKIDEKAGSVDINYDGQPSTLTFEKNGAKGGATATVTAPGALPPTGGANPAFRGGPASMPPGFTPTTSLPMPNRDMRTGNANAVATADGTTPMPTVVNGIIQPGHFRPTMPVIDPVEQQIHMYKLQEEHKDDANFPPMPPTDLSKMVDQEQSQGAPAGPPGF